MDALEQRCGFKKELRCNYRDSGNGCPSKRLHQRLNAQAEETNELLSRMARQVGAAEMSCRRELASVEEVLIKVCADTRNELEKAVFWM